MQLNTLTWLCIWVCGVALACALPDPAKAQVRAAGDTTAAVSAAPGDTLSPVPVPVLPLPSVSYPFIDYPGLLYYIPLQAERTQLRFDSTGTYYSQRLLHGLPVAAPYVMDFGEYAGRQRRQAREQNWQQLIDEYERSAEERQGLLDFQFDVPGGEKSAFTTIFGKNEVNLRVNGTANLNVGASIQKNENPEIPPDQQTQVDPTFNQNLKLNIEGTIGDKLSIQTNWDTEAAFDFQNRVNIVYQGYDNEILQRVELGNVAMETGNSLIRGGSALFGVKSVAQIGSLRLTSVLSQQNGESNTQTITGGAREQQIDLRPGDYEYDRHFFLDFYNRQEFEQNLSDPQQLGQALQLSEVNVWVLRESSQSTEGERQAIALVDLGVIPQGDGYGPPDESRDAFSASLLNQYRDPSVGVSAADFGVDPSEFVEGYFVPLQEGTDYELNRPLGYLSLKRNLGSRQALAVSFKYVDPQTGQTVNVGDVSQGGGNRIYLKMIRPQTVTTNNPAWDLMMKNIYSLGVNNITQDGIEVDVKYTEQNVPSSSLPQRSTILLQDLGLDRVDQQGAVNPDNRIDFSTGTLNPVDGRIIFPYLQPFGSRIRELLQATGLPAAQINDIVFDELYEEKKVNANQSSKNNFYRIDGTSKGSISESYSLGFSPVEGSVRVFANGRELQEGTEYTVDYSIGTVSILDDQYLRRGQEIKIEYENNQLSQIQQKTFTGLRAEYSVSENFNIGSTYFRLNEQPVQDKIRIGDEPVNNTVIGLDANADFDLPWLTRLIDQVPLLQTRTPSWLRLSGEFAQLRPGVAQTNAVQDAIDNDRLYSDEQQGLSFIDDFEGVDIGLSFLAPSRWSIAAAPAAVPGYGPDDFFFGDDAGMASPPGSLADKIARSDLRSKFSWYTLPRNLETILGNVERTPETAVVEVTDVFPNRDVLSEENVISTLDIHYDPTERGPYNYNDQLRDLLTNEPQRTWGGMVTTLPSGQEDLSQNNIEFLEFWVQPVLPDGRTPNAQDLQDYDGTIYIDVGVVSEDVVPNFKTNTEDGLVRRPDDLEIDNLGGEARSYIPNPPPAPEGQFSNDTRELEDVGLDGAPSRGGIDNKNEQVLFSDFIEQMRAAYGSGSAAFRQIQEDPSNDDYVYYGEDRLEGQPVQQRFFRLYGYTDGNTPPNTGDKRAVTNKPDTEGLITPSIVQQNNAYFQYEVKLNPADTDNLEPGSPGTYIVDEIPGDRPQDRWYQVRVPLNDFMRKVGDIENFQNVSHIRVWMSGYEEPFTLRFATFELVGSQWRDAENVHSGQNSPAELNISSINIEENSRRRPIPYRQPEGAVRATNRSRQRQTIANEQSLVLDVQNLGPGDLKMVKRVYPGGLNMVNYSNVRMFVHGEGYEQRGELELVVRFGTDLVNNYYEYRQPVSPSDPDYPYSDKPLRELSNAERDQEAEQVWLYEANSMNILLSAFNQLKQLRDQQGVDLNERFERSDLASGSPAGATLAIKGNPSLDRVGEIGMGVRNPFDANNPQEGGVPSVDAQVWLNELRVSGFDNRNGWAANGKVELQLADFATMNLNINRQTDGFGALNSRLGQRRTSDEYGYDLNSTFNMHKFIPERYGWSIPLSLSARRSTSTPRYLPNQGDVTLDDFKRAVNTRGDLSDGQKESLIDRRVRQSQTAVESYSFNIANATKNFSESPVSRYTLDNTTLNFVYNTTDRRNPQYSFQNSWNYSGSLRYNIDFDNTLLFRPFGFLGNVPVLHPLAGLRLGYTPASFNTSVGIDRDYNEQRRRALLDNAEETPAGFPIQQSHAFSYNTNLGFSYNLTPAVKTSFQSQTIFDLSRAGIEPDGRPGTADSLRFRVRPTFDVLGELVTDTLSARRNNYQEAYTADWQPRLDKIEAINWIDYSASYTGGYQWRNSPDGSGLGATVTNNFSLSQSLDFDLGSWLDDQGWYGALQGDGREQPGAEGEASGDGDPPTNLGRALADAGRGALRALLSIRSIDASFNIATSSLQTGYAGSSPFFAQFGDSDERFSPPFSYRTGFINEIGRDRLIDNPNTDQSIQLPSNRNLSDNATMGMRFTPVRNLNVDLTWNTQWDKRYSQSITIDPEQSSSAVQTRSGNVISSVWSFGKGYESFFRRQLGIALADIGAQGDTLSDDRGNGDGRSVLGKRSLQESFRGAYLGVGTGVMGERGFTPIPLPGWRISWSNLEDAIPWLGAYMRRASLLHAYSGRYRLGYVYNADQSLLPPLSLGRYVVRNRRPAYEPTTINIEKTFAPLIGLNVTWQSDLRTNLQYDYSKLTSLALSNATVIERYSRGLKLTVNYTLRDFKIPLFPRIRNAVDVTVNTSYIRDTETKYVLSSDLDDALELPPGTAGPDDYDFSSSFTGGQARINGSAIVGYQFSQTIKANFEYVYNRLIPKSTGVFPRTDHDIRFNVIVNIRSN